MHLSFIELCDKFNYCRLWHWLLFSSKIVRREQKAYVDKPRSLLERFRLIRFLLCLIPSVMYRNASGESELSVRSKICRF